jgi:hypothetical protein
LAGKQCEGGLESFILEWEIIMGQDILIFWNSGLHFLN